MSLKLNNQLKTVIITRQHLHKDVSEQKKLPKCFVDYIVFFSARGIMPHNITHPLLMITNTSTGSRWIKVFDIKFDKFIKKSMKHCNQQRRNLQNFYIQHHLG